MYVDNVRDSSGIFFVRKGIIFHSISTFDDTDLSVKKFRKRYSGKPVKTPKSQPGYN